MVKDVPQYWGRGMLAGLVALGLVYRDRAAFDEKRPDIHQESGWPILGNIPEILKWVPYFHEFGHEAFTRMDQLTGKLSVFVVPAYIATINPKNVEHILKSPEFHAALGDLFGNGIFNANGEEWRYQRKTASLVFNVKNFRDDFTSVFVQEMDFMSKHILDKAADECQVLDFHDLMYKFTLDSFVLLGFGVHLNAMAQKGKVQFAEAFDDAQKNTFLRFINPAHVVSEALTKLFYPNSNSMKDNLKIVDTFAREVTEKRREELASGKEYRDLLSRFMTAKNMNGQDLSNDELRDIVLNFIIAGRDTTAQALSWCFHLLCQHPRVERKLYKEVDENITEELLRDAPALFEVIKNMKYAHAVFYEVLRLYPSVPLNMKYALNDDVWPDGTHIRKGDYILWHPFAQGRSQKVWGEDAREFVPERWITPDGELRRESQGQWPAFHAGPRVCLGQHLATLESLIAISYLMKYYRFSLVPGQNVTYQVSLTLPMKYGMKVTVEKRA
ncbi:cytochrome P450 [Zychaea mexicana]|uniref:cytochrome P450 n=1 Tax=Zychaea mexicana TaxID=64656 RepID=UPI0022FE1254|nr:cytochrome P450 [Zychaea mexicana]KAI9499580.1 cytochrome P450 [Zychaea mexicana]